MSLHMVICIEFAEEFSIPNPTYVKHVIGGALEDNYPETTINIEAYTLTPTQKERTR